MKICFLAGTLGQGGAERQLFYILNSLKKEGVQLDLICLTEGEVYEEKIKGLGVNVHYAGASSSRFKRLFAIIALLRKIKPDLVQSQHFYTNIYVALASKFTGIKGIGASRNNLDWEIELNGKVFGKLSFWLPEYLIANSKESIGIAIKLGKNPKKLFYLPNAVDAERFKPLNQRDVNEVAQIVNVGRNVGFKRQWLFINLMEILIKNDKIKVQGHIYGDGPENKKLKELAFEKGLSSQDIVFHGDTNKPEVFLQKSDIFVLTSEYEGTPNVVLEAMACGLPVICTAVGNLPNFIKSDENGFLINEKNIEEDLYTKVLCLVEDKNKREKMGNNARETALREFSFVVLGRQLKNIYSKIVVNV